MIIYLAGGVSGNLNPAWKLVANGMSFYEALVCENSHPEGKVTKELYFEKYTTTFRSVKKMKIFLAGNTIFPLYIAPILYGGAFSTINENISGKPSHNTEIQRRNDAGEISVRGFL